MKTTPPDDPQLRGLLREWKSDAALPPRFQEGVWRRIERADIAPARLPSSWGERLLSRLFQPKWATAGLLAVVLMGGLSGLATGAEQAQNLAQGRYVAAVDPYHKGH